MENIKKKMIKVTWLGLSAPHGHSNGYVGVKESHPWFKKHYDDIDIDIHGGLTYSELEEDGYWWVGFDVCHFSDNLHHWNLDACKAETERLFDFAVAAAAGPGK